MRRRAIQNHDEAVAQNPAFPRRAGGQGTGNGQGALTLKPAAAVLRGVGGGTERFGSLRELPRSQQLDPRRQRRAEQRAELLRPQVTGQAKVGVLGAAAYSHRQRGTRAYPRPARMSLRIFHRYRSPGCSPGEHPGEIQRGRKPRRAVLCKSSPYPQLIRPHARANFTPPPA